VAVALDHGPDTRLVPEAEALVVAVTEAQVPVLLELPVLQTRGQVGVVLHILVSAVTEGLV